jgi:hypothetical protein
MTKLLVILVSFFVGSLSAFAQKQELVIVDTIPVAARWIVTDKMQHLFVVKNDHTLLKYDAKGELLYEYNENSLGEISSVDVQNPFFILVYYNDYTTVVILDRTLSEVRRQDLADLNIDQVQAIGIASDNNIWLFDNNTFTLKKIDAQNHILLESNDLSMLSDDLPTPTQLIEYQNQIYLNSPENGILVFDQYATYFKTISVQDVAQIQLYEQQIFFVKEHQIQAYELQSFLTQKISLPFENKKTEQINIAQGRLYLRLSDYILVAQFKKIKEK